MGNVSFPPISQSFNHLQTYIHSKIIKVRNRVSLNGQRNKKTADGTTESIWWVWTLAGPLSDWIF